MKKKNKKLIFIIILILLIVFICMGIIIFKIIEENKKIIAKEEYSTSYVDGTKKNTSIALSKSRRLGNLEINNIELTYRNGVSALIANVKNNSNQETKEKYIKVEIVDKSGNTIEKLNGIIKNLNAGESTELNITVTTDIVNCYDFKIEE